jgi:hypothetical protein
MDAMCTGQVECKWVVKSMQLRTSRAGEHARNFLGQWNGKLVCDDFAGNKANFQQGITEIGYMAHARRKFFDLHATNKSQLAEQALHSIGGLYEVERQAREMTDEDRWRIRQEKAARQQPDRKLDPAMGARTFERVVCWIATQRKTGGGDHELDPVGAHEWA